MSLIKTYLKNAQQTLTGYWQGMQFRERIVLTVGVVLTSFILFWALIWQPWQNALSHMQSVLPTKRLELSWMRAQDLALGDNVISVKQFKAANQSLMSVIEQSARASAVQKAVQQIVPQDDRTVSVALKDVSFNRWIRWVDTLQSEYGVRITQLSAEREDGKADVAEIRAIFSR